MADGKIKISELNEALTLNNDAEFPYSQENGGVQTSFKAPIEQIARKVSESITYTNLTTTAKTLVGAINELKALGSPILLGTSAPTAQQGANGNLYVQYTEGTGGADDEVDAIFVKIDGAWCEISTGGGGGSGGHTIVDNDGTSLTQRTNLQFKGTYLEDNSTDNTTEVNVVRSMTYAEFQQLTDEEKEGLIEVTDITSGEENKFQPIIYSTEEREIGVWKNGKPLYEIVYEFTSTVQVNYSGWTATAIERADIENIIGVELFGDTNYQGGGLANLQSNIINLQTTRNGSVAYVSSFLIRYTKTADTPGSGQWSPQGVPTHHYSTSEKIVGTWIDGSTIYERTFDKSSVSLTNASWANNVLGTNGSGIKIRKFSGTFYISIGGSGYSNSPYADYIYYRSSTEYFTAVINDSGDDLNLRPNMPGVSTTAGVCTIQYTKVST